MVKTKLPAITTLLTKLASNLRQTTRKCVYLVTLVLHDFRSYDLALDPITLIYKLDLDIPKMYQQTENEGQGIQRSRHKDMIFFAPVTLTLTG